MRSAHARGKVPFSDGQSTKGNSPRSLEECQRSLSVVTVPARSGSRITWHSRGRSRGTIHCLTRRKLGGLEPQRSRQPYATRVTKHRVLVIGPERWCHGTTNESDGWRCPPSAPRHRPHRIRSVLWATFIVEHHSRSVTGYSQAREYLTLPQARRSRCR